MPDDILPHWRRIQSKMEEESIPPERAICFHSRQIHHNTEPPACCVLRQTLQPRRLSARFRLSLPGQHPVAAPLDPVQSGAGDQPVAREPKVDEKAPDCPRHTVPITRVRRFTPVFFCPLFRSRHRKFRQLSLISRQTGLTRNPGHPKTMSGNCGEDIKLLIRTQITASIICGN